MVNRFVNVQSMLNVRFSNTMHLTEMNFICFVIFEDELGAIRDTIVDRYYILF